MIDDVDLILLVILHRAMGVEMGSFGAHVKGVVNSNGRLNKNMNDDNNNHVEEDY